MFLSATDTAQRRRLRPSPATLNRAARLGPISRCWGRAHARLFKATGGRLLRRWVGVPVLVLETVGRRSGKRRATPILRFDDRGDFVVVAANAGSERTPAWFLNLMHSPDATVVVDGKRWRVRAELAQGAERARLWRKLLVAYAGLEEYTRFARREFPIVRLRVKGPE